MNNPTHSRISRKWRYMWNLRYVFEQGWQPRRVDTLEWKQEYIQVKQAQTMAE